MICNMKANIWILLITLTKISLQMDIPLSYKSSATLLFLKENSTTKIYNPDVKSFNCHLQIFCPYSSCITSRISSNGITYHEFYEGTGDSDLFIRHNITEVFIQSSVNPCVLHYNCHKSGKSRENEKGIPSDSNVNPYWDQGNSLRSSQLRLNSKLAACETNTGKRCVSGVYKVESNSMMSFHTQNCFPGLSAQGRNLNPYSTQKEYYCPTELHHDNTLYRSMPKFWKSLAKCTDPNPACYSDYPLEILEGISLKKTCNTKSGIACFDKPWMDQNGYWHLGCTFMLRYNKWKCPSRVGNTGIALQLEECLLSEPECLNSDHHMIPKGFMDDQWMKKPWMRIYPKDFHPTTSKE